MHGSTRQQLWLQVAAFLQHAPLDIPYMLCRHLLPAWRTGRPQRIQTRGVATEHLPSNHRLGSVRGRLINNPAWVAVPHGCTVSPHRVVLPAHRGSPDVIEI